MRGSQKTKLAATIGFALIAILVLGGMTWATLVTLNLERRNVREDQLRNVRLAVSEIDSHMRGVLTSEAARPFTDYFVYHVAEPAFVWSEDGQELEAEVVALDSPIRESGPPHEWIDLYFQVDENGIWTSPQVPCDTDSISASDYRNCPCAILESLKASLPVAALWERVAQAAARDQALVSAAEEPQLSEVDQIAVRRQRSAAHRHPSAWGDYRRRSRRKIAAQRSSFPTDQCVPVRLVEKHLREQNVEALSPSNQPAHVCSPPIYVGLSPEPMVPIWLELKNGRGLKLAFVRSGYEDGKSVKQGFLGDWDRLREDLLEMILPWFPEADLEPVPGEVAISPATSETAIASIHARLEVPEVPGGVSASAWRNIRGVLFATWGVALAVLVLGGWGVRNLVALTERRMQFAYAVTHELRTPLTTFRLYADMLAAGMVPEEATPEYLETLNRESVRLSGLVEGVLEYARLDNHQVKLNPVDTDASSLLDVVAAACRNCCAPDGIETQATNYISNGARLRTDVDLVRQIAGVLVNNACRHARGAEQPTVFIRLSSTDGKVLLDVIDSGPGVDRADSRTIFKPFRRGRRARAMAQGGIGLGLALARSWAELLGGRLDLAARHHPEHGGAHFRLTIPIRVEK